MNNENNLNTENQNTENQNDSVTMTQDELDKKLQGAADKVRTEYSKKINELKAKIKELTPPTKTEAELDFEKRLAALEAKEQKMALMDSLAANNISRDFADYFKSDVDIEAFKKVYDSVIEAEMKKKIKSNGYKPESHKAGATVTKEEFDKMTMSQREELYNENLDIYRSLVGRK